MVAHRTLTPFVRVRILHPLPHWYTGYDTIACVLFCVYIDSPKDSDTIRKNEVYLLAESKLMVKDAGETDPIGLKYSIVQNTLTNALIKLFLQYVHLCVLS